MVDFPVTVDINCNTENKTTRQEGEFSVQAVLGPFSQRVKGVPEAERDAEASCAGRGLCRVEGLSPASREGVPSCLSCDGVAVLARVSSLLGR